MIFVIIISLWFKWLRVDFFSAFADSLTYQLHIMVTIHRGPAVDVKCLTSASFLEEI